MKFYRGSTEIIDVIIDSKTQLKQSLQGINIIQCNFTLDSFFEFKIGDYVYFKNKKYTIFKEPSYNKKKANEFEYVFDLDSDKYRLLDAIYMLDGSSEFSLRGDLEKFANLIVVNLNRLSGESYYQLGELPQTSVINLTFQDQNCLEVLQKISTEFDYEFLFSNDGRTISFLEKIGNDTGVEFEFKKGLRTIKRDKINEKSIITNLYAFGGSRNLPQDYGSKKIKIDLLEKNTNLFGKIEGVVNFEEVYPHRIGSVTSVDSDIYKFTDNTLDFNINDQLLPGLTAKVTFNTGYLAGYEFEISNYNNTTKTFTLIPYQDNNGVEFPNDTLKPLEDDKYVIHDIEMPQIYVDNAHNLLLEKSNDYLIENSVPNVVYSVAPDPSYLRRNLISLNIGDIITVKDNDLDIVFSTRIIELTQSIADEYIYSIKVGNKVKVGYISRVGNNLTSLSDNISVERQDRTVQYNRVRRSLKNIDELRDSIFDPDGYFETDNIKPLSIETNMLSVGSKGQQFIIRDLLIESNYEANPNRVKLGNGTLVHFTIDTSVKEWNITGNIIVLDTPSSFYYIYAKCNKSSGNGLFELSTTQYQTDQSGYYYFLIGVIHSVIDNVRGISLTYGQTTINGKFITTGKVQSVDGLNYFDLDNNQLKIGNSQVGIDWNVTNPDKLTIKGGLVQSPAGASFPIAVFRGEYSNTDIYYLGDQVSYNGSTYIYNSETSTSGQLPTNTDYWEVSAKAGETGDSVYVQYSVNGSSNWHNVFQSNDIYMRQKTGSGSWSNAIRIVGEDGQDGQDGTNGADGVDGQDGASIVWKGTFSSHPSNPQNGWAYKNNIDGKSYVYQDGTWYQMTIDGVDGANGVNGNDGVSIEWKGESANPPGNPQLNWVYRDTDNGLIYIYNGTAWVLMVRDGNDGEDGTDGSNGFSVYITYHDNAVNSQPETPTGNGTLGGWSTTPSASSNWMSQKVSDTASSGSWSAAILIKGEQGEQGIQGIQGIAGQDGANGQTTYFHIKYAPVENPTAGQMSETPNAFIGTYVDFIQNDSTNPNDYNWFRFQGLNGEDGIPGQNGQNGETSYLHIAYADDVVGGGFSQSPDNKSFIGTYTDFIEQDSTDETKYNWSKIIGETGNYTDYVFRRYPVNFVDDGFVVSGFINNIYTLTGDNPEGWFDAPPDGTDPLWMSKALKNSDGTLIGDWSTPIRISGNDGVDGQDGADGVKGEPGEDGKSLYTWIKYADDVSGNGLSNSPIGKEYIGFSYNKTTAVESDTPIDYIWSKIVGDQGDQGVPGVKGEDGINYYTWIKYADNSDGTGLYDTPTSNTQYIGISINNTSQSESTDKTDYIWSKFKGDQGNDGADGADGADGVDGQDGPAIVFRGEFNQSNIYYNNSIRKDVVKYNGSYYIYDGTNGIALAWSASNWVSFGAEFESVATKLLLAEEANIGDWVIKSGKISSQSEVSGEPKMQLDGTNGIIKMRGLTGNSEYRGMSELKDEGLFIESQGSEFRSAIASADWRGGISSIVERNFGNYYDGNLLAAVYGKATNTNSNPARTFGGYFVDLMARGLFTKVQRETSSSAYYIQDYDVAVHCHHTSGTKNVYLPSITFEERGRIIFIKTYGNNVTIQGNGKTIDTVTTKSLIAYSGTILQYDGSGWGSLS